MVISNSLDEWIVDQILQYYKIVLNINDRAFIHIRIYIYIYIYILNGGVCDPGFYALSIH